MSCPQEVLVGHDGTMDFRLHDHQLFPHRQTSPRCRDPPARDIHDLDDDGRGCGSGHSLHAGNHDLRPSIFERGRCRNVAFLDKQVFKTHCCQQSNEENNSLAHAVEADSGCWWIRYSRGLPLMVPSQPFQRPCSRLNWRDGDSRTVVRAWWQILPSAF